MNAVTKHVEPSPPADFGGSLLEVISKARELLSYEPETGDFRWRVSRGRMAKAGDVAGTLIQGRVYIKVCGKMYLAHRLAFAFMTGRFPDAEVDHINGEPSDNRWRNLRPCSRSENMQNKRVSRRNKSGLLGVSKHRDGWQATIAVNKVYRHLGLFPTPEAAHAAYLAAKAQIHGFNPKPRDGGAQL